MCGHSHPLPPNSARSSAFCAARSCIGASRVGEDEQDQRLVVAQRHAPDHAARLAVRDVDILIARPVAARFESGDDVAEPLLETLLRPEDKPAHVECRPSAPMTRSNRRSPPDFNRTCT